MKDLGVVQMVFIEELNRRGEVVHRFVLMCTGSLVVRMVPPTSRGMV